MRILQAGSWVGQRFMVEAMVGAGGMGRVYRARDTHTGLPVALKVMLTTDEARSDREAVARFEREASLLSGLRHPAIVSFVESGLTDAGLPFLVMEWLEGEDLEAKLSHGPLSVSDTLALIGRIAGALVEAVRQGVVHRDLKPGNIFLRDSDPQRATLLDFGIARRQASGLTATKAVNLRTATGVVMGTPYYMAPEQAHSAATVGPAADVFSLGCIFYECLSGRPPFAGEHVAAVLAQILFDEPPALSILRPDLPTEVSNLVASMLCKQPAGRPTAAALLEQVPRLATLAQSNSGGTASGASGIGRREQRLATIILASVPSESDDGTWTPAQFANRRPPTEAIMRQLAPLGVQAEVLADQSVVVALTEQNVSAVDQAAHAATCALTLAACWPTAVIAVATGRSTEQDGRATGEALARAGKLLAAGVSWKDSRILVEDVTVGLLGARAQLRRLDVGVSALVSNELSEPDAVQQFLGKPRACVGRETDLGSLELALAGCISDASARAVVVVAEPGIGKSRLRHELCRRLAGREDLRWTSARAEALRIATPLGLMARVLRNLCGVAEADSVELQRQAIVRCVTLHLSAQPQAGTAEFLGELCGVPFPEQDSVLLRTARQTPQIMGERMRDAWCDLLVGMCTAAPLVLIFDDLHWSDRLSLDYFQTALQRLSELPLLLVGFARPELDERFPDLWKGRVQRLPLRPLNKQACLRFVKQAVGDRLSPALIQRLVDRSAGNVLFLEELTRAALEGTGEDVPETVLAMLQARIGRLDEVSRQVLRAASIFGQTFGRSCIDALLGSEVSPEQLDHSLELLVGQEIIEARRGDGGTGARSYAFRHALVRDAAYARCTEADRRLGHRLAARLLEASEPPPVVAEHYAQSDVPEQACPYWLQAAEQALQCYDVHSARSFVQRVRAFNPTGELLAKSLSIEAVADVWAWRWNEALVLAEQALPHVPAGSTAWCHALHIQCFHACYIRPDKPRARALGIEYIKTDPAPEALLSYCDFAGHAASALTQTGAPELGRQLLLRAAEVGGTRLQQLPAIQGWHSLVWCSYHRYTDDDIPRQLELAAHGVSLLEQAGAGFALRVLGHDVFAELLARAGQFEEALTVIARAHQMAAQIELTTMTNHLRMAHANVLVGTGLPENLAQAESLGQQILQAPSVTPGYRAMVGFVFARVFCARGERLRAKQELERAIALSQHTPARRLEMVATQICWLFEDGEVKQAAALSRTTLAELDAIGAGGYGELPLLEAAVEALVAAGSAQEAEAILHRTYTKLRRLLAGFRDESARLRFRNLPRHARILALVQAWPNRHVFDSSPDHQGNL